MNNQIKVAIIGGLIGIAGTIGAMFIDKLWPDGDFEIVSTQIEKKDDYELIDIKAINNTSNSVFITDVVFDIKKTWISTIASVEKSRLDPSDEINININPGTNKVTLNKSLSFVVKSKDGERIVLRVGSREATMFDEPFWVHVNLKLQTNLGLIPVGDFILGFNPQGVYYDKQANQPMASEILATNYPMSKMTKVLLEALRKP